MSKINLIMNFFSAMIESLVNFVRRNPLTVLFIIVLALTAPALLRGLATLILYLVFGFILFIVIVLVMMRWRLHKVRQQVQQQFNEQQRRQSQAYSSFYDSQPRQNTQEGEVKVRKTGATPEKRIANDVGDYVEFEETKE